MELKKTKFGNIIWIIYGILTLLFSALIFTRTADYFHIDQGIGLLLTVVFTLIMTGICFAAFSAKKHIEDNSSKRSSNSKGVKAFAYFMFVFLLLLGVFCRFFIYNSNAGASVLGSFKFDMILQVALGACAFYLLKRISGYTAALIAEAVIMFSPTFTGMNPNLEFNDYLIILLFALLVTFTTDLMVLREKEILPAIFGGFVFGFLLAYDISALALVPVLILYYAFKPHYFVKKITLLLYIVLIFIGFAAGSFVISLLGSADFVSTLRDTVYERFSFRIGPVINFSHSADIVTGAIVSLLLMAGIPAGYLKRSGRKEIILVVTCFSVLAMCLMGLDANDAAAGSIAFYLFVALAAASFSNTFVAEKKTVTDEKKEKDDGGLIEEEISDEEVPQEAEEVHPEETKTEEVKAEEIKTEEVKAEEIKPEETQAKEAIPEETTEDTAEETQNEAETVEIKADEETADEVKTEITESQEVKPVEEPAEKTAEEPEFKPGAPLENPLPGPKKHEPGNQPEYDYYVSENADYDI